MFKSFSDTIRSLWQSKTSETVTASPRKRKRSSDDSDLSDSDVEILSVKKPRQENSSSGFFSFLTVPMSKMSDWVRKKTEVQDHVFVQPVQRRMTKAQPHGRGSGGELAMRTDDAALPSSSHTFPTTNGPFTLTHNTRRLTRLPINTQNGPHENGVNGDVHIVDVQPGVCSLSSSSSRRSSYSSVRPGRGICSTVAQCFQLKEKEDYRKLLQQYTTLDLGYGDTRAHTSTTGPSTPAHTRQLRGKFGLPVLSMSGTSFLSSLPLDDSLSSKPEGIPRSRHIRVRPSQFAATPPLPSDRVLENSKGTGGKEGFGVRSGLCQNAQSSRPLNLMPARHTSLHAVPGQDEAGRPQSDTSSPTPVSPASEDVVILDDSNSSLGGKPHFMTSPYLEEDWLEKLNTRYAVAEQERQQLIKETEAKKKLLEERREDILGTLDKRLRKQMKLFDEEVEVIEEVPIPEVQQEIPLPELTAAMEREIDAALANGPAGQVLSEGYRLQLTRGDFATLRGLNWLNDEVINFYMNMLMERGEQAGGCRTYAFNTFFYPKLISGGHEAVRRWTRKVDLFSHEFLVIPVHLGVHWCLCVVFIKEKCIRYYDSMGGTNSQCLNAIRQYLYDESLQKRNIKLDLSEWSTESVKEIPQQMNGSDCGMFTCMYAETLTRGANISFTQKDMPYFRRRVAYELLKKKLL